MKASKMVDRGVIHISLEDLKETMTTDEETVEETRAPNEKRNTEAEINTGRETKITKNVHKNTETPTTLPQENEKEDKQDVERKDGAAPSISVSTLSITASSSSVTSASSMASSSSRNSFSSSDSSSFASLQYGSSNDADEDCSTLFSEDRLEIKENKVLGGEDGNGSEAIATNKAVSPDSFPSGAPPHDRKDNKSKKTIVDGLRQMINDSFRVLAGDMLHCGNGVAQAHHDVVQKTSELTSHLSCNNKNKTRMSHGASVRGMTTKTRQAIREQTDELTRQLSSCTGSNSFGIKKKNRKREVTVQTMVWQSMDDEVIEVRENEILQFAYGLKRS